MDLLHEINILRDLIDGLEIEWTAKNKDEVAIFNKWHEIDTQIYFMKLMEI